MNITLVRDMRMPGWVLYEVKRDGLLTDLVHLISFPDETTPEGLPRIIAELLAQAKPFQGAVKEVG